MQSVSGAQFLNVIPAFPSSNRFEASLSLALGIVIVSLTSMYATL